MFQNEMTIFGVKLPDMDYVHPYLKWSAISKKNPRSDFREIRERYLPYKFNDISISLPSCKI